MSISTLTRKVGPTAGNGVTTVFPFAFKVFQASDLRVVQTTPAGDSTDLLLTTNYTVFLNNNQDVFPGGTVTMLVAPPTGYSITIGSKVPFTQPAVFTNSGGYLPTVLNGALDRQTILTQQVAEIETRTISLPFATSPLVNSEVTAPQANTLLGWDATATKIVNYSAVGVTASTTAALFDNSLATATTAFVKRVGINFANVSAITTNYSIVAADFGKLLSLDTGGTTVTMPAASTIPAGAAIALTATSIYTAGIVGADRFVWNGVDYSTTRIAVGDVLLLVSNGVSKWRAMYLVRGPKPMFTGRVGNTVAGGTPSAAINFTNVDINRGNCWNNGASTFTPPVDGVFRVSTSGAFFNGNAGVGGVIMSILVNGVSVYANNFQESHSAVIQTSFSHPVQVNANQPIVLNANTATNVSGSLYSASIVLEDW